MNNNENVSNFESTCQLPFTQLVREGEAPWNTQKKPSDSQSENQCDVLEVEIYCLWKGIEPHPLTVLISSLGQNILTT